MSVSLDGTLFLKIDDPVKASYDIEDPQNSLKLLAQTIMRSEIGKLNLDELFQERNKLNMAIYNGVSQAAGSWGIRCLRYEILNIDPPESVKKSMQSVVEAERTKRREIIESEAKQIAKINVEESARMAAIMEGTGRADAIRIKTEKEREAMRLLSEALGSPDVQAFLLTTDYIRIL